MVLVLKNVGERSTAKTYHPVSFLSVVSKVFENLYIIIGLLITKRNVVFFLISSMVLGLLDHLQVFSQLYLIELLGLFSRSGATRAVALDISKTFKRVWHAGLLHKRKSY